MQPGPNPSPPEDRLNATVDGFDPVRQLDQEIAMEQRRLKLRELHEARDEQDRRAKAKDREAEREAEAARAAERDRDAARQREIDARQAENAQAEAARQRQRHRRELIQDVKREVIDRWAYVAFVNASLKAEMFLEVERALSPLPVEELPFDELVRIAAGVRDRLHDEAKRAEQQAQQRTLGRDRRRQQLRQEGMDYAKRELGGVDGLDGLTKWSIEQRIARALEETTGDETPVDIEDLVEDILEREGIGYDDGEEDDDSK